MHAPSRRGFVRKLFGGLWTGAALLEQSMFRANVARAQAQSTPGLPELFEIEQVADGVYAAIAKPLPLLNCNAAIFEQENHLLMFDAHSRPSAVVSLVSQVRRMTKKPVRYIVNSHFHWDHSQGTPAYRSIAPGAQVITSVATRDLLSSEAPKRVKQSVESALAQLPEHRKRLEAAKTPAEKTYWQLMVRDTEAYAAEMKSYAPELPNITFDRDLILHDKAHDLHLAWRGKGHTMGDVVVYCPQKKVIATGDLMHGFAPFIGDGYPALWPGTLREVAKFPFETLIGGHGAVQRTRERVAQKAAYIEELTEAVRAGKSRGRTSAEVQNAITPASLKSLRGYGEFLGQSLSQYLLQAPGATAESIVEGAVRSNAADIYRRLESA